MTVTRKDWMVAPIENPGWINGYSIKYMLRHPRKRAVPHKLPPGWRWLMVGEVTRVRDVSCDPRSVPVQILKGGDKVSDTHHPIRRKLA